MGALGTGAAARNVESREGHRSRMQGHGGLTAQWGLSRTLHSCTARRGVELCSGGLD